MTIYFGIEPQELDDKSLDKQIKSIAQVLCNVHYMFWPEKIIKGIPLKHTRVSDQSQWARESIANYKDLVELGLACLYEYSCRFSDPTELAKSPATRVEATHGMYEVIEWARDNVPDLPLFTGTAFPLVVPKKYIIVANLNTNTGKLNWLDKDSEIIESYRNYYAATINRECNAHFIKHKDSMGYCRVCHTIDGSISNATWTRREKPEWLKEKI